MLSHPIRNQVGTAANRQKSLSLLERKSITFRRGFLFPIDNGGLISVMRDRGQSRLSLTGL